MDALLQSQFDRVETALNALIESITTYQPQPATAADLLAADTALGAGLALLERHQQNHTYLLALRAQITRLEDQVQTTFRRVADTRRELLAAKPSPDDRATGQDARSHPVRVDALLAYARNISRFTVPPTQALHAPPPPSRATDAAATDDAPLADGPTVPAADADGDADGSRRGMGVGWTILTEDQRVWLDQMARAPFMPWPNEESIKNGVLAATRGVKPVWVVEEEQEKETDEGGKEKEKDAQGEGLVRGDDHIGVATSRVREPAPQPSLGFDLYDPDE